jgi:HD-GYP domain-containing protein (c-di-GMP phosphodiesterase class II)
VDPDHLPNHFLRNFLLTINIAAAAGFSEPQVMEMGEAAMLADIGMIMIQDNIRFTRDKMAGTSEWEIRKHPILGLYALERLRGIPDSVSYAAYQHHERINGKGYPNGRSGKLIHPYSQIVSIADVFNAMCNERAYRKAYNPAEAMKQVLDMALTGLLRKQYVRNLLKYFSAFPVGSLVLLNNRSTAKVVQSNEKNPMKPVVSVLTDSKENYLPENKIFQVDFAEEEKLGIIKPLESKNDLDLPMRGF